MAPRLSERWSGSVRTEELSAGLGSVCVCVCACGGQAPNLGSQWSLHLSALISHLESLLKMPISELHPRDSDRSRT